MPRMHFIDQKIRNRSYPNCASLAREYEVSEKTIQRDIECMRNLGAPIAFDRRQNGYYYSDATYYLPALPLTEREALLFVINERILSQYQQAPYYAELKQAIEKILQFLPDDLDLEHRGDFISFQAPPQTPVQQQKFDQLQEAICDERQIRIQYYTQHRNEVTDRTVDPYLIHCHQGNWYLIAHCHVRNEIRIFALNRILAIELTDRYFSKPADFSIEAYLKDSFNIIRGGETYHVALKFSPYQARWIREKQWHQSQKLTELDDGGVLLEMDVKGLSDVKRWVLQYGAEVEVLAPEVLREDVLREIGRMGELYRSVSCK
ncbi:MAG: transcriptional regulator [candidate division KSB1 bacterium]|nr:transcriptional regulator [candidate division KSB1 bacterium]